jgi:hypothetical protein
MGALNLLIARLYGLVWTAALWAGLAAATGNQPKQAKPADADHDFGDKVLVVHVKGQNDGTIVLEQARTTRLGGRIFVVGRVADVYSIQTTIVGSTFWVATDEIGTIVEYADTAAVKKSFKVAADPAPAAAEVEKDFKEMNVRSIVIPLKFNPAKREKIAKVTLFISEDRGKTWQAEGDYGPKMGGNALTDFVNSWPDRGAHGPDDTEIKFSAPHDGLYWFALQIEWKDGTKEPAKMADAQSILKVYINSEQKVLKPQSPPEDIRRELEELRKTVEELKRKIAELEAGRNPQAAPQDDPGDDVTRIAGRRFEMPLDLDATAREQVKRVRLFVSEDRGKTWNLHQEYGPDATSVSFEAPRDGLYWFAIQSESADGRQCPPDASDLEPSRKVLVETAVKSRKAEPTTEDLRREKEALRKTIEHLKLKREVEELRKTVEALKRQNAESAGK